MSRLTSWIVIVSFLLIGGTVTATYGQNLSREIQPASDYRFTPERNNIPLTFNNKKIAQPDSAVPVDSNKYPDPTQVMYKSLMIPGWGQLINDQVWKIPLVYAALGGLTYYSIYLNKLYHDYRAAYYNNVYKDRSDRPYGPTPTYLQNVNSNQSLKKARNFYRNRRDFIYVTIGLAYGLNALDAYVFAHMKSFNVSDNLSVQSSIKPTIQQESPALTLRFDLVAH